MRKYWNEYEKSSEYLLKRLFICETTFPQSFDFICVCIAVVLPCYCSVAPRKSISPRQASNFKVPSEFHRGCLSSPLLGVLRFDIILSCVPSKSQLSRPTGPVRYNLYYITGPLVDHPGTSIPSSAYLLDPLTYSRLVWIYVDFRWPHRPLVNYTATTELYLEVDRVQLEGEDVGNVLGAPSLLP